VLDDEPHGTDALMPELAIPGGPVITYEDIAGPGVPIIFSHGLFMSRNMFGPQLAEFSDHRCVVWDERAHGDTVWSGEFTYWDSAADLFALADHLGIDSFIHVGFSQGGLLALRAALLDASRFIGMVQMSTQAGGLAGEEEQAFRAIVAEWIEKGPTPEKLEFLVHLILGPGADERFWRDYWSTLTPQQLQDATYALYDAASIEDRLHEITPPVLVIHGLDDVSTPLERGVLVAERVPDSRGLTLVENGPHANNLTHPELVNSVIRTFVDAVSAEHRTATPAQHA
jgi:pimeloyl-ACP methyl ester carboxylesterase